jgi:hypothetical protein
MSGGVGGGSREASPYPEFTTIYVQPIAQSLAGALGYFLSKVKQGSHMILTPTFCVHAQNGFGA